MHRWVMHERRTKFARRREVNDETCRRSGGGSRCLRVAEGQRAAGGLLEGGDGHLAVDKFFEPLPRGARCIVPHPANLVYDHIC